MVKITADSTCDLSPEILNSMGITLTLFNKAFRDGVDIMPADIFRHV
jgi:fatty acid-binding protein DegV